MAIVRILGASESECVVLLCNEKYFTRCLDTLSLVTGIGNYHGDICVVIGDDLVGSDLLNHDLIRNNNVIIKHFPDLQFSRRFLHMVSRAAYCPNRLFQYHKIHLFDVWFKQWKTILYLDCGMHIYSDIHPILNVKKDNKLLAHSDAHPTYEWRLYDQFNSKFVRYYEKLSNNFNLNINYFQTTMMLYDTNVIKENTFQDLYNLCEMYPISKTNDQGIIALYFTNVNPVWEQIPFRNETHFLYDFFMRDGNTNYIMHKYLNTTDFMGISRSKD